MTPHASLDLAAPPPIPDAVRERVSELLASGLLHRYGEQDRASGGAAQLEVAFANLIGTQYAVATNSCGSALHLALRGAGVKPGDPVLMGAFTLAPVPGAIVNAGGQPVPVEITEDLVLDIADLKDKAVASGAKYLLVSHMRGHVCDLELLVEACDQHGLVLIEDCAHSLGAHWNGRPTGSFGHAGCFSFQSWKHVNAGEGGILVTSDPDIAARAILHSGSYMLYRQNGNCPPDQVMERWRNQCANFSLRLSELAAELALGQLSEIGSRARDWNASHDRLAMALVRIPGLVLPKRSEREGYVQSSLQFRLPDFNPAQMAAFIAHCRGNGLHLKWFGNVRAEGYTSAPRHWSDLVEAIAVPRTQQILDTLCDLRIPLGLSARTSDRIVAIIDEATALFRKTQP